MNLDDFIAQSLTQIATGIEKANANLMHSSAHVNPNGICDVPKGCTYGAVLINESWAHVQEIKFDIAVTVVDGTEAGGKIGISVGGFNLGANGRSNQANTSASRIQFTVPMVLPINSSQ
ncbi:hypothetical protein [Plesiomonas shigelloides]|uniref:hypothetical protein n=1 Tax=Plesiomonas shigelloides TaxID=703 RepID=UPI001181A6DF|nr:hypothetical protein [Plesiomonas shigelloides]